MIFRMLWLLLSLCCQEGRRPQRSHAVRRLRAPLYAGGQDRAQFGRGECSLRFFIESGDIYEQGVVKTVVGLFRGEIR